jgi:hypothetical protein
MPVVGATPTVTSLCACAESGTQVAAAIAAIASILFRMIKLLRDDARRIAPAYHQPIHREPHRSFQNAHLAAAILAIFAAARNPKQATDVCYLRTGPKGRMLPSIPFPENFPEKLIPERFL